MVVTKGSAQVGNATVSALRTLCTSTVVLGAVFTGPYTMLTILE
jgi:hypothetical protein